MERKEQRNGGISAFEEVFVKECSRAGKGKLK
jgi:hypothetical protein